MAGKREKERERERSTTQTGHTARPPQAHLRVLPSTVPPFRQSTPPSQSTSATLVDRIDDASASPPPFIATRASTNEFPAYLYRIVINMDLPRDL